MLGYSAEMVSAEWLRYHPEVRTNRKVKKRTQPPIIVGNTHNVIHNSMQIRLEISKVATDVMDAEVQFETRATAAQR